MIGKTEYDRRSARPRRLLISVPEAQIKHIETLDDDTHVLVIETTFTRVGAWLVYPGYQGNKSLYWDTDVLPGCVLKCEYEVRVRDEKWVSLMNLATIYGRLFLRMDS